MLYVVRMLSPWKKVLSEGVGAQAEKPGLRTGPSERTYFHQLGVSSVDLSFWGPPHCDREMCGAGKPC
jgi:hypothetical protein